MACTCGEWGSAVYVFCRGEASLSGQPKLTFGQSVSRVHASKNHDT
jgi:hypothetical protein